MRGVPCPTFKHWGGSQVLDPRVPRSRGPGSTFTPCPKKGGILLKGASKYHTTKHFQSLIIWQLLCNFTEIALTHGCSPVICCTFSEHLFLRNLWTAASDYWFLSNSCKNVAFCCIISFRFDYHQDTQRENICSKFINVTKEHHLR